MGLTNLTRGLSGLSAELGTGSAPPWTPAKLASASWWAPGAGGYVTMAGALDLTAAGGGPTYNATAVGGTPGMVFGSTKRASTGLLGSPVAQPFSVTLAVHLSSAAGTQTIFDGETTGNRHALFVGFATAGQPSVYASATGGGPQEYAKITTTGAHVFTVEYNGASTKLYRDGFLIATGDSGTNALAALKLGIEATTNSAFPLAGAIGHVVMYPTSDANRVLVENYVGRTCGRILFRTTSGTLGGNNWELILPYSWDGASALKIAYYQPGHGETEVSPRTASDKAAVRFALLDAGYAIATSVLGSTAHWGNDASVAAQEAFRAYVETLLSLSNGNRYLWAQSMGGASGFRTLAAGSLYRGLYGTYPVADVVSVYDAQTVTYGAGILAAWGAGSRSALVTAVAGKQPVSLTNSVWSGKRIRMTASPDDTVVPKASNADVIVTNATAGGAAVIGLTAHTGDHGDPSAFTVTASEIVGYFDGWAA